MKFKSFELIKPGTTFDFVGKWRTAVVLSLIANAAIIIWSFYPGLNFGVDFAGGTEMQVAFAQKVDAGDLRRGIEELGFEDAQVQTYGDADDNAFLIRVERIALMDDADVKRVVAAVQEKFPVETWSFNPEIGDKLDFQFKSPVEPAALRAAVEGAGIAVRDVREEQGLAAGTRSYAVITQGIQEKVEQGLGAKFAAAKPDVQRVEYVGPAVGRELRYQGLQAILYAMMLIVVYVGLRFDFRFGPGVIMALIHDAVVTVGYYAFTGREFNLTSIAVILTIIGYSVNDTVVIYDRIRENQGKYRGRNLRDLVNLSINETLGRTAMTNLVTMLSLIGLLAVGVGTIFDFAAAMLFGMISGTYSTWFIAGPMTIWLEERSEKKKKAGAAKHVPAPAPRAATK
jgi:preprotein translocase subunit SecF